MDTSRLWVKSPSQARRDHFKRYELATRYASGRVLDAACGCGYGSKMLLEAGQLVVGVDASPQAISWAEEHFQGPHFVQGLIEEETWSGKFETVVTLETIEHIRNPELALKAFRRACVGTLIASVPNQDHYPFVAERFANDDSPHFRHYRPHEFEELLKEAGFKVTERFCQKDKAGEIHAGSEGMFIIFIAE